MQIFCVEGLDLFCVMWVEECGTPVNQENPVVWTRLPNCDDVV